ncbi:uncharacterized protein LOC113464870 isoform X2 [Ceratina calcarata]|uniref:Uncharacterized protein LOC113464870 isoform X2 n=1 Tax=Ceratina calcarata TaxID=156304 RepID=A0AAJ7S9P4_9HYME|nr:uncharacterized protein LOC113464870 isoform X2 [Ceratina calcarata]
MILFFGGVLVACVVFVACITPPYCRSIQRQHSEHENESSEDESTLVQIQVTDLGANAVHSKKTTGESNREHSAVDSNKNKEQNEIASNSVYSGEARIVPVKVYTYKQHRVSGGIWSSVLKDQLQNITNSSSEVHGSRRIVRAQIERNPTSSSSIEPIDAVVNNHNCSGRVPIPSHVTDQEARKLPSSSAIIKRLKKILRRRSQKALSKHVKSDGNQSVPTQTLNQCSPLKRKSVSTSTRLSVNGSNVKTRNGEVIIRHDSDNDETVRHLRPDSHQSNTGPFQEMVSLIKRESTNGNSVCDLRIRGLVVNQSQLLELFNAAEGVSRNASIVTTEEASVLTIKFNRRRESSEGSFTRNTSFYECPLVKFYRNLPQIFEDLSISKLFHSQDVSNNPQHDSCNNHLRNDSSYKSFPKITNRFEKHVR